MDNFLMKRMKGLPRSRIYRIIRRGEVRLNKKRCKPDTKLTYGDEIRIPPFTGNNEEKPGKVSPGLEKLLLDNILYENDLLLVINKPAGIAVHRGTGIRLGIIEALRQLKPEWKELELAHRLDRDTSGCLIVAKDTTFLRFIQDQLKQRRVKKHYLALVHGNWPASTSLIDAALTKNAVGKGERVVVVDAAGKPSTTAFAVVQGFPDCTLIEAMPRTGRTHQIRVHCQFAGHAIVGDPKYTAKSPSNRLKNTGKLCLHAWKIEFLEAESATPVRVEAPLDRSIQNLLDSL